MINIIKQNYKKYIFCLLINILIFGFVVSVFYLSFETNDDLMMKRIVSGAYGIYDYHMVFSNSLLGQLFIFLYSCFPIVSWYEIIYYLFILLSLTQITYIYLNSKKTFFIFSLLLFLVSINLYSSFQFTKIASVLTSAGCISIIFHLSNNKNKTFLIVGLLLIIIGYMVRAKQSLACIALCGSLYIPYIKRNQIKSIIIVCAICVISIFALHEYDAYNYKSDEWKKFLEYNVHRGQFMDNVFLSYDKNKKMYSDLGITENAYKLLSDWDFKDPLIFSSKTFEDLHYYGEQAFQNNKITIMLSRIKTFIFDSSWEIMLLLSIFSIVFLFFNRNKPLYVLSTILGLACLLLEIIASAYLQKFIVSRTIYPLVITLMFYILFFSSEIHVFNIASEKYAFLVILAFVVIYIINNPTKFNTINVNKMRGESYKVFDNTNTYVLDVFSEKYYTDQSLFVLNKEGELSNMIPLGGWTTYSPSMKNIENNKGITNPYINLIDDNNVYLVTTETNIKTIVDYIEDYYDRAYYEEIDYVYGDIFIYKIYKW